MTDELSFVEEIRRSPDDLIPRLIYADYLEDCGNPQGEFIRVQCELSEMPPGTSGRSDLLNRERELLDQYCDEWLQPVRDLGAEGVSIHSFERGLLERVRISAADFLNNGSQLCSIAPALCSLQLRHILDLGSDVLRIALPEQISMLDLSANGLTADWLDRHSGALASDHVTSVSLQFNRLGGPSSSVSLFSSACWPALKAISLGGNQLVAENLSFPADPGGGFNSLRNLDLRQNPFGDSGFERLFSQYRLPGQLRHLNVSGCRISSIRPLVNCDQLPNLKELVIRQNRLRVEEWNELSSRQQALLDQLDLLDTRNNQGELPTRGI